MTQEFRSAMLGVRQPGVTIAVGIMQKAGLVLYEREHLHVLDCKALENLACGCYGIVCDHVAWLTGEH